MKKLLSLVATLILLCTSCGVYAQTADDEDIFEYMEDAISTDTTAFGFSADDVVQAVEATESSLTIVAPVIYDGADPILDYDLSFAGAPRADLDANDSLDQAITKSCSFTTLELQDAQEIECELMIGSDIQPEQTYYLTIFPKKNNGLLGTPSEEITFKYEDIYNNTAETFNTNDSTHASAPDMCTANISWSQDNDKVTVTWDALVDSGNLRIEARGEDESTFRSVGTAAITAEKFVFTPSQSGTYLIKLVPLDRDNEEYGKACTQTMHLQDFTVTEVNTQTGPKETLIIIGLLAVIGGYFLLRRKH